MTRHPVLPPLTTDLPNHEQGPRPCSKCVHSYTVESEPRQPLRCGKSKIRCTFERDEFSPCGEQGRYWMERVG